jgi:hypothetical protein
MPFSLVQSKTAVSTVSGTAITCTYDNPPTRGNLILGIVFTSGNADNLPDSNWAGGHWISDLNACTVWHYPLIALPTQTSVFSVTSPTSVSWAVCLVEYSAEEVIADDVHTFNTITTAGVASYTATTSGLSYSNDLIIVSFGQQGAVRTCDAWSNGFTEVCDLPAVGTIAGTLGVAHKTTQAGVDESCTVTLSGTISQLPAMLIQAFTTWPGPSRSRVSQQSAPGGW